VHALTVDRARVRDLRRMKVFATALLVFAAVVFVVARTFEDEATWVGYVEAAAEAAMVGALADWFAVTALFRYPLGIPIPHTAIIPKRKDDIGRSLGEFVQGNFLTPEVIGERLAGAKIAERLGHWLAQPVNAERAGEAAADALGGVVEVLDDRDVQEALGSAVEKRLKTTEVAPLLSKAIDVAVDGGHHQRMLDGVMRGLISFLDDNRAMLRDRLDQESPWWVPEAIDDRVFNKIFTGVERFLADVSATPNHEVRRSIDARIRTLAVKLRHDAVLIDKCETMKLELLEHPDVQGWLQSLWGEVKSSLLEAASDPNSDLRRRLVHGFATAGRRLGVDQELQDKVDGWIERLVLHVAEHYRGEVAELISSTVERWDSADTGRRIELQVGRDLQFIRINGTVVGGLAGLAIHTFSELVL
jgi:uncharacterized membrane-anchored protein YjiN (DUF445 family)